MAKNLICFIISIMRVSNVLYNAHNTHVKRVLRYPRSKKSWKFASNIFLAFSSSFFFLRKLDVRQSKHSGPPFIETKFYLVSAWLSKFLAIESTYLNASFYYLNE